ncbi:hypothetical protein SAMN05443668_1011310 [Cryptosporangium aurantiacum]|uniref:SnoaL-like domain-containing protein n=2 Tax=Cryptosporangium aurantiacum TaxID=134849 RepID=A0A1M7KZT3_9ACTN|nr:hypothetical protein SAMN05443668_1011310 [Cryptosporangium aurantiacum]
MADVESVVRGYVGLVRAGRVDDAVQLVDHSSARHVLASLWRAVAEAVTDPDDPLHCLRGGWEHDLSWLGEFDIAERVRWSETGSHLCADVTYRGVLTELELSFWVKPAASGWIVAGPATLW